MNHYPAYTNGRLSAQAQALLDQIAASPGTPLAALSPARAREEFLQASWLGTAADIAAIETVAMPGPGGPLHLRTYRPHGHPPFPLVVFFHGGGFVLGALEEFDVFCSRLASGAGALVVSVDYRLAPEHKFPAAAEDAVAAVRWLAGHAAPLGGDAAGMAVAGDSAGGNLAAVVSTAARDDGSPRLVEQVLICPWLDLSSTTSSSFCLFGNGSWLSTSSVSWYTSHYLATRAQATDRRASPLLADRHSNLPPTLVIAAEFDVLRDQGVEYAARLREGGTPVDYRLYPGTLHDFATLPGLFDQANDAIADICSVLEHAWRR